jgi:hypothetical protein
MWSKQPSLFKICWTWSLIYIKWTLLPSSSSSSVNSFKTDDVLELALEYPGGLKIYEVLGHINVSERKILTVLISKREDDVLNNIDKFSLSGSEIFNAFIRYFSTNQEGNIYMDKLIKLLKVITVDKALIVRVFSNFFVIKSIFEDSKEYVKFLEIAEKQGHDALDLTKDIAVQSKDFDARYIMGSIDTSWHNEIAHALIENGRIFRLHYNLYYFNNLDKFVHDSLAEYFNESFSEYKDKFTHLDIDNKNAS